MAEKEKTNHGYQDCCRLLSVQLSKAEQTDSECTRKPREEEEEEEEEDKDDKSNLKTLSSYSWLYDGVLTVSMLTNVTKRKIKFQQPFEIIRDENKSSISS